MSWAPSQGSPQLTLNLRPDAKPVFCKPRPVPFALKEALGKELDRLETAGTACSSIVPNLYTALST